MYVSKSYCVNVYNGIVVVTSATPPGCPNHNVIIVMHIMENAVDMYHTHVFKSCIT